MITIKKTKILKSILTPKEFTDNLILAFCALLKKVHKKDIKKSGNTIYFGNINFQPWIGRGYINGIKDGRINISQLNGEIIIDYQFSLKKLNFYFMPALFLLFFNYANPKGTELYFLTSGFLLIWGFDIIIVLLKMKYIIEDSIQNTNEDNEKVEISPEQMSWINDETRCPACGCKILEQTLSCPDCGLALK